MTPSMDPPGLGAVVTLNEALAAGMTRGDVRSRERNREWSRLRHGVYLRECAVPRGLPRYLERDLRHLYRAVAEARVRSMAALSDGTGSLAYGLPVASGTPTQIHLMAGPRQWTGTRNGVVMHLGTLQPWDVAEVDVVSNLLQARGAPPSVVLTAAPAVARVVSPARAFLDIARRGPLCDALSVGDAALSRGLVEREQLALDLSDLGDGPGSVRAARALRLLDGRRESAAESLSTARFVEAELPLPRIQVEIYDDEGMVGRVDFLWEEYGIIGEVDGAEKYTDPSVLLAQGQRESRLRAMGYIVVRWTWAELWDGTAIRRIRAAIRAARAA